MRPRILAPVGLAALLVCFAGCHRSPAVLTEAKALEAQGKLAEAATKYELVCAMAPTDEACLEADANASGARLRAAEKAITIEHFVEADRLLHLALITSNGPGQIRAAGRQGQPDLQQGLEYERAIDRLDKRRAYAVLTRLGASGAAISERATEWLERERPALVVARVREICRPPPSDPLLAAEAPRSCSELEAELKQLAPASPAAVEARRVFDAEQQRVAQLVSQAEALIGVYGERGRKTGEFRRCLQTKREEELANPKIRIPDERARNVACTIEVYGKDDDEQRKTEDDTWRRLLVSIRDPKLVDALELRRRTTTMKAAATTAPPPVPASNAPTTGGGAP